MTGYPNDQSNPAGATPVWIAPPPGSDSVNITTATSVLAKTGEGVFLGITVAGGGAGSQIVVRDGVDGTGTIIGTFSTVTTGTTFQLPAGGVPFVGGLYLTTSGGTPADLVVSFL